MFYGDQAFCFLSGGTSIRFPENEDKYNKHNSKKGFIVTFEVENSYS